MSTPAQSRSRRSSSSPGLTEICLVIVCCVCCIAVVAAVIFGVLYFTNINNVTPTPSPTPPINAPTPSPTASPCADYNILWVENLNDTGTGSFRQAIIDANARAGHDCIRFKCTAPPPNIIFLETPLPVINDTVDIDGTCNGANVCLEGTTMTGVNCSDDGVTTKSSFCFSTFGTPILEIGDRTNSETGLGSHSVVRHIRFSNEGLSKNNVQPEAAKGGACNGLSVFDTSYVDVLDCEFMGFTTNMAALFFKDSAYISAGRNIFDRVLHGIMLCGVAYSNVYDNTAKGGFPALSELEEVDGIDNGAYRTEGTMVTTFQNNSARGFDAQFFLADSVALCVANNTGSDARFSSIVLTNTVATAIVGNTFDASLQHVYVDFNSEFNPILGNSLVRGALYAIDNTPDGVGFPMLGGITFNDAGDADMGGNELQNYPVFLEHLIDTSTGTMTATGMLNSVADTTFAIQCFVGTDSNRNADLIARTVLVTTNGAGDAPFDCSCGPAEDIGDCRFDLTSLPDNVPLYISGTATREAGGSIQCLTLPLVMMQTVARWQRVREHLTTEQSGIAERLARSIVSVTALASYVKDTPDVPDAPTCTDGGVVCLESNSKSFCDNLGLNEPKCASGETPRCMGSTSEVSYAYRADPPPAKVQGVPSSGVKVAVGLSWVLFWAIV